MIVNATATDQIKSDRSTKTILVTGATGDTGRPTVKLLLERGHYNGPRKLDHGLSYSWLRKGETMAGKRQTHTAAFKAQVALAALKGERTVNELASQFGVHPTLIHGWKKHFLQGAEAIFTHGAKTDTADLAAPNAHT